MRAGSLRLREINKQNHRRVANGCEMPGELEATGFLVDLEDGDIVRSLVT